MKTKRMFLSIFITMMCLTWLTGCTEKKPVTLEEYQQFMSGEGFTITDATDQITGDSITAISLAIEDEYQIEFYQFKEAKYAVSAFNQNQSVFESYVSGAHSTVTKNIGEYAYYSLVSGGTCYILARVDNTLIYAVADDTYKNEITELIRELGY